MTDIDPHDVYVHIGRRGDQYNVLAQVFSVGGEVHDSNVRLALPTLAAASPLGSPTQMPPEIGQFIDEFIDDAWEREVIAEDSSLKRLLLDVERPELFS